jgi:hypothetical protein
MYNLLISYYFSILFDVLHEKFGLRRLYHRATSNNADRRYT